MTSKVLYELLIRSYARFKYFSRTWNLTIFKSKSVNQRKCEHHGKIIFSCEKIQKMEHPMVTNDLSLRCKLRNVFKKFFVKKIKKVIEAGWLWKLLWELYHLFIILNLQTRAFGTVGVGLSLDPEERTQLAPQGEVICDHRMLHFWVFSRLKLIFQWCPHFRWFILVLLEMVKF